jgi:branched-chain amino acid transport system ATP-binding protein
MTAMLELDSVTAGYGESTVLRGVDFHVDAGEVVALLGPNGAGKTTLLKTATGFVKARSGSVRVDGAELTSSPAHRFVRQGVCHLPEGRGIFPSLTVKENLTIFSRATGFDESLERATELFPVIGERLSQTAGSLSGGEQQMLALSRVSIARPKVVLVDEASMGLAPLIVDRIYDVLGQFAAQGMALVVVEQYVQKALDLAARVYILNRGALIHEGPSSALGADEIYERYLGIEA